MPIGNSGDAFALHVRGDVSSARGRYVDGLHAEYAATEEQLLAVLERGEEQRKTSATKMNKGSSRSHSVFTITVHQTDEQTGRSTEGKLNLVDLAVKLPAIYVSRIHESLAVRQKLSVVLLKRVDALLHGLHHEEIVKFTLIDHLVLPGLRGVSLKEP